MSTQADETQPQQVAAPAPEIWPFAAAYKDRFGALPGSQQREAIKRLTLRARSPLTVEKLTQESPDVEACLTALFAAYSSKKERARVASAAKRATDRETKKAAAAVAPEPGPATAAALVEVEPAANLALAQSMADLSLEPASVCCEEVPRANAVKAVVPVQAASVAETVQLPPVSQPIPAVPAPKPVAQKTAPVARGLGAMLKR
jgi:hypothetical protein